MDSNRISKTLRQPEGRPTRALLVYPEIPETYWSFKYSLPFVGKKAVMPPLGLLTVAALLPDDWDLSIVDMNVSLLTDEAIRGADLVLISAMIIQKDSFAEVASRVRRAGVPVVAGGPYPSSCSQDIEDVDCFILNEGEITIPQFLADYNAGTVRTVYSTEEKADMTRAPVPRFDLLPMADYGTVPLQFSRGCPFDCEFCDIVHLFGRVPRTKTPEQFIREMDAAYATGFRGTAFIVDDNFIGNKRAVKDLLSTIIAWQKEHGYPFAMSTEASINLAEDEELMDLMAGAGFTMVFVGIETPVAESLSETNKNQNLKNNVVESIKKIQARNIEVSGGFVIGFDSDPENVFDLQIKFIRELAVPTAMVGLLTALPHTKLFKRLQGEGRLLSDTTGNNTHSTLMNFIPKLSMEKLADGYRRVLETIYSPRVYFERCLELLRRYPSRPRAGRRNLFSRRIALGELLALPRSLVRQTFSSYGYEYIRYLMKSLFRYPGRIVEIITMAIQGHHFITITKEMLGGSDGGSESAGAFRGQRNNGSILMKFGNEASP